MVLSQMLSENIASILKMHVAPDDRLIVAVSGGPDSTALLHIFAASAKNLQPTLIVAHVNHGLRGADSDADEKFVRNLAASYGLSCEVKRVRIPGTTHVEERGRKLRRIFFESLQKKYHAKWIVTAHTADDQLETILMNFLRGCGPNGLAGMRVAEGAYLKPFLGVPKSDILTYLKSRRLKFCKDKTNDATHFRRNFIRKNLVPLLAEINPSFSKTWLRNSEMFGALDLWLQKEAQTFLRKSGAISQLPGAGANHVGVVSTRAKTAKLKTMRLKAARAHEHGVGAKTAFRSVLPKSHPALFSLTEYRTLEKPLQHAVIQESYRSLMDTHYRLPYAKVLEIAQMFERGIGNKKIRCGGGGVFTLKQGKVFFAP